MSVFPADFVKKHLAESLCVEPACWTPLQQLVQANRSPTRTQIEQWVEQLQSRKQITCRLQTNEEVREAYNELATKAALQTIGYKVQFQPRIGGRSPDMIAVNIDGEVIVEVFTVHASDVVEKEHRFVWQLTSQLKQLTFGADISVMSSGQTLETDALHTIVNSIEQWLRSAPAAGSEAEFGTFSVRLHQYREQAGVISTGPGVGFFVNDRKVFGYVEEKVYKYKSLAEASNAPLLIVIAPDFRSGIDKGSLEDVAYGSEKVSACFNYESNEIEFSPWHRDGRFGEKDSAFRDNLLSGLCALGVAGPEPRLSSFIRNPIAKFPLPSTFER